MAQLAAVLVEIFPSDHRDVACSFPSEISLCNSRYTSQRLYLFLSTIRAIKIHQIALHRYQFLSLPSNSPRVPFLFPTSFPFVSFRFHSSRLVSSRFISFRCTTQPATSQLPFIPFSLSLSFRFSVKEILPKIKVDLSNASFKFSSMTLVQIDQG